VFFSLYQFLPSQVDKMTIEDYWVVKANADAKLDALYDQDR
jgi:hypothetical protein